MYIKYDDKTLHVWFILYCGTYKVCKIFELAENMHNVCIFNLNKVLIEWIIDIKQELPEIVNPGWCEIGFQEIKYASSTLLAF